MTYDSDKRQRIADIAAGVTPALDRAIARLEAYLAFDPATLQLGDEGPPFLHCDLRAVLEVAKNARFIAIPRLSLTKPGSVIHKDR